ncbi:MAG: transcription elongation factor GreA [Candidatus Colwellbacteria bacterium RIFCSPHIGHO2_12_FULL_43_12]|uniref:Transcription elongation factor GreA n=3 Tax=Candidatus Colwelliibacteriota TaxID=1817904 RepID=A0A1G1Z065_9BACT|nr:MAG: transcription elongation factor GreA [Candidatus Colwellbacteria bacterium RIFCSPHIGHO2_02_FULL_43_15]OGY59024.1 MAG: transcription elongation factor GreA [Candidatus Colwellbacteria bacterium RIFCSPHIGHO2_12_FULL_43_12]OGY60740.1 MAG: transcription elongation factor GreA [Candidatus Colwellbacteria bacterium RIFCSPLOWO2_12_FULL_43_11]
MDYYVTQERLEELKAELSNLKTSNRVEIANKLKRAKEFGDLSENAEYLAAREEQANVERRIGDLEEIVRNAVIIKKNIDQDIIDVGSTVEVRRNGQPLKFNIVGSEEAKPEAGLISNESPIGKELLGHKVGDSVKVDTPNGEVEYKIFKLS